VLPLPDCVRFAASAVADTIEGALAQAYINNPQLNSQRAQVRAPESHDNCVIG
jgi:hypothetical protein